MTAQPSVADFPVQSLADEVKFLVDLVRMSRVTLLYGEAGPETSSLLRLSVMPLLQDTRAGGRTEVAVFFDAWERAPLPALHAQLHAAIARIADVAAPDPGSELTLTTAMAGWQETLGVSFLIVFDRFEDYLRAPLDSDGIKEFEDELVRALNEPSLRANFLLSVDERAEPLLRWFRERVAGFGNASVRLSRAIAAAGRAPERPREDAWIISTVADRVPSESVVRQDAARSPADYLAPTPPQPSAHVPQEAATGSAGPPVAAQTDRLDREQIHAESAALGQSPKINAAPLVDAYAAQAQAALADVLFSHDTDAERSRLPAAEVQRSARCPKCGEPARDYYRYCRECGARLPSPTVELSVLDDTSPAPATPHVTQEEREAATVTGHAEHVAVVPRKSGRRLNAGMLAVVICTLLCAGAAAAYWVMTRAPLVVRSQAEQPAPPRRAETDSPPALVDAPAEEHSSTFRAGVEHNELQTVVEPPKEPAQTALPAQAQPHGGALQPQSPRDKSARTPSSVTASRKRPQDAPAAQPDFTIAERAEESLRQESPDALPRGRTSTQTEATARPARTIDEIYQQRIATCGTGVIGVLCRETIKLNVCDRKWVETEVRGMTVCRVVARREPIID